MIEIHTPQGSLTLDEFTRAHGHLPYIMPLVEAFEAEYESVLSLLKGMAVIVGIGKEALDHMRERLDTLETSLAAAKALRGEDGKGEDDPLLTRLEEIESDLQEVGGHRADAWKAFDDLNSSIDDALDALRT